MEKNNRHPLLQIYSMLPSRSSSFHKTINGFPLRNQRLSADITPNRASPCLTPRKTHPEPIATHQQTHTVSKHLTHNLQFSRPSSPYQNNTMLGHKNSSCINLHSIGHAQKSVKNQNRLMGTVLGTKWFRGRNAGKTDLQNKQKQNKQQTPSTINNSFRRVDSQQILKSKLNKSLNTSNSEHKLLFSKKQYPLAPTHSSTTNQLRKCLPSFNAVRNQIPAPLLTKIQSNSDEKPQKWIENTLPRNSCKQFVNRSLKNNDQSLSSKKQGPKCVKLNLDQFWLGPCRGQGRYGKVFYAIHKATGWSLALKQIKKQTIKPMAQQFINELKVQYQLNHPNITKLYGYFHDEEHIYLLLEYMEEGSLYKRIKQEQKISEQQTIQKIGEVCEAVSHLHRNSILHRDIKPQNIVISHGVCKLCDFGWSVCSKGKRKTCCGTIDYTCPQVASGNSYNKEIDVWAIGVLAFQMLTGKAPFYHFSRQKTMTHIMNCEFDIPSFVSEKAKNFIVRILNKDEDERMTRVDDLLSDVFLQNIDKSYIL